MKATTKTKAITATKTKAITATKTIRITIVLWITLTKKVATTLVLLNYCILNAKFFIYKCKLEETRPIFERFLLQIKSDYEIEEHIARLTKRITQLNDRWKLLRKWIDSTL